VSSSHHSPGIAFLRSPSNKIKRWLRHLWKSCSASPFFSPTKQQIHFTPAKSRSGAISLRVVAEAVRRGQRGTRVNTIAPSSSCRHLPRMNADAALAAGTGKLRDWRPRALRIGAALAQMKAPCNGHIINVQSVAGRVVRPGSAVHAATKTAARMICEGPRQEGRAYNIRTTAISPGAGQPNCPTA
jgi:short chain dehydrogenase